MRKHTAPLSALLMLGFAVLLGSSAAAKVGDPYELRQLRELYEEQLGKLRRQYTIDTAKAPERHISAMLDLEKQYQMSGDLRSLIAVRDERKRFTSSPSISDMVLAERPDKLRALQMQYIQAHEERKRNLARNTLDLSQKYVRRLQTLEKDLTKKGRIEDALKIMEEAERIKTSEEVATARAQASGSSQRVPEPAFEPRIQLIGTDVLSKVVRGEIVSWNSMTGDITCKYNFTDEKQVGDWEGGTRDDLRGRLVCDGAAAWFHIPFKSVSHVEFEGFFFSGDGGIKLRLGRSLTAEIGAGEKKGKMLAYQNSELFPVTSSDRGIEPFLRYTSVLAIGGDQLSWSVNGKSLNRGKLEVPIRYPVKLGVGNEGSRTMYDDITITGTLSLEHLRTML